MPRSSNPPQHPTVAGIPVQANQGGQNPVGYCVGGPHMTPAMAQAPVAQAPPMVEAQPQRAMQVMQVQVPQGMQGGMPMQVQTPGGVMQVQIPPGLQPGTAFHIQVPVQPAMAQPASQPTTVAQGYVVQGTGPSGSAYPGAASGAGGYPAAPAAGGYPAAPAAGGYPVAAAAGGYPVAAGYPAQVDAPPSVLRSSAPPHARS